MQRLLSIRTVFPRPGNRGWYDDQRVVHRQVFEGVDGVDYAFMGNDPEAADNRRLREAFEAHNEDDYKQAHDVTCALLESNRKLEQERY